MLVVPAIQIREPDRYTECEAGSTQLSSAMGYEVARGLSDYSQLSERTSFGRIETNIERTVEERQARGESRPITLLEFGPGNGNAGAELKYRFNEKLSITGFAFENQVLSENQNAFYSFYVGNGDTHALPRSYDRFISVMAIMYVHYKVRFFQQILEVLAPQGEAFMTFSGTPEGEGQSNLEGWQWQLRLAENEVKQRLFGEYGLTYEAIPESRELNHNPLVFLRKEPNFRPFHIAEFLQEILGISFRR